MEKVQDVARGPADELAKALSKSDFQKAAQALEKLQKQLANSQLDSARKEELAKQFQQLKQKIDEMAQQAKDAQADLQNRANQMNRRAMRLPPASSKTKSRSSSSRPRRWKALQNLANKLGQCSKQMQQGQNAQAAGHATGLAADARHGPAAGRVETLDGAMEQLADARNR